MTKTKRIVVVALSISIVSAGLWFSHEIRIDHCLDAGGRFDYQQTVCQFAQNGAAGRTLR